MSNSFRQSRVPNIITRSLLVPCVLNLAFLLATLAIFVISRHCNMSRYPDHLSADITPTGTPTKLSRAQRSRQRREPSGVFSLFSPTQIQQFREAFSLIDHDADGIVNEQDLRHIFASLGMCRSSALR